MDVGVNKDGLIHRSRMNGTCLTLGNQVKVAVVELNVAKGRIGLGLIEKL